jgi:hypothetical protein
MNDYQPPSILLRLCDKYLATLGLRDNLARPKHAETFAILAKLTGLAPRELAQASIHHFAQSPLWHMPESPSLTLTDGYRLPLWTPRAISQVLVSDEYAHFCPDCLREAAYQRRAWMLQEVSGCVKHRRVLLERCPQCQAGVPLYAMVRGQCGQCHAHLADAAWHGLPMKPVGVFAQRTIQGWWGTVVPPPGKIKWTLPDQPVPVLHSLVAQVMDSIRTCWIYDHRSSETLAERHTLHTLAFKVLLNWPIEFCAFLRECLEQAVRRYSYHHGCDFSMPVDLHGDFLLATWLGGFEHRPGFSFVQTAVDRFVAENHIQVDADSRKTHIRINAEQALQRMARPIAQSAMKQWAEMVERL